MNTYIPGSVLPNLLDNSNAPTLYRMKCPYCGSDIFRPLGLKGAMGKSIGIGAAFGAIGAMVASSMSQGDLSYEPIKYQCEICKKKFEALPLKAQPDEILSAPCRITITRLSSFVGMAVSQMVYINGIKVGSLSNKGTVMFDVVTRYNTLFITDQYGMVFRKNCMRFEANPGDFMTFRFKGGKFK